MQVVTTLSREQLEGIAADNHVQLYDYRELSDRFGTPRRRRDGRMQHTFTIRPALGDETYRKVSARTGRRIWAVCWHGHFQFMAELFDIDPHARIRSAMARYDGRDEFYRLAGDTRWLNVGSHTFPAYADDECAGNHGAGWLHREASGRREVMV